MLPALLLACLHRAAPPAAPEPLPVAALGVLDRLDAPGVEPLPAAVLDAVAAALAPRNLPLEPLEDPDLLDRMARVRPPGRRMALVAAEAEGVRLVLLLAAHAEFAALLGGRYRWVVSVEAALAPREDPAGGVAEAFDVPVFLDFHHQREREALEAAAPVIARRIAALADELVGAL